VSELRSAIDAYRAESLACLPDARVEEDFAELQWAAEQIEVERLRRLAEIERRRLHERDGHLSAAAWLARAHRVAPGLARGDVRVARALERMPATRRALQEAQISLSAARVLAGVREADPAAFARSEPELVEAARIHSTGNLQRVAAYWREAVEQKAGADPEEKLRARRRLHASVTFMGMVRLDGDLDPETGETLLTALRAVLDAEARSTSDEDRSPAQRRADALGEICRQWLEAPDRPSVAGERPHVTVTVGAESLRGDRSVEAGRDPAEAGADPGDPVGTAAAGSAELDHVGPVPATTARRLACDASVMRVVLAGRSEPLDVGRRTKVVPPSLRRAVIVRDRGCRFPGCDRPHTWCDAHHVVHWADGGPTALPNLVLLCRRHHRMIHLPGGFRLELVDGHPTFLRPDGSILQDETRAPP
jgi:hypothetical protein